MEGFVKTQNLLSLHTNTKKDLFLCSPSFSSPEKKENQGEIDKKIEKKCFSFYPLSN